jgi:prepilin-type N-terminal cleavage/methylation domain-containing protein
MTNVEKVSARGRQSGFVIDSSFVIRLPRRRTAKGGHSSFLGQRAFTLLEVLVVITIMIILAGLLLSTFGYMQKKGARARAETEIAAMSAACESYKADNGIYPRDANTDTLAAVTDQTYSTNNPPDPVPTSYNSDPTTGVDAYKTASFRLYALLSGNLNGDRSTVTGRVYFQFKPNMLYPRSGAGIVVAIVDPFGNCYGYSTAKANYNDNPSNPNYGFNPTFDLWSTSGTGTNASQTEQQRAAEAAYEQKWIKNW